MKKFAVVGNPIKHSLSPFIHEGFREQIQGEYSYDKILSPLDQFEATIKHFFEQGGSGLNVTLPFKEEAYRLCEHLTMGAKTAKAVNTLAMKDGKLWGHNSDGIGLVRDLTVNLGLMILSSRILVLGAGGAVRGILGPLTVMAPKEIVICNRTISKAEQLVKEFQVTENIFKAAAVSELADLGEFDLIIHATSAELSGGQLDLPTSLIGPQTACYDLFYNQQQTTFVAWAQRAGVKKAVDGLGMLIEQAAESASFWHNCDISAKAVINTAHNERELFFAGK
ncbi:shikimate dehydrogenase [Piscirickettsia litoralis]|uniref:Shikimate dehydrogenase (NADP(+)) n=1 Tax=Piscirickettsia litoralis TaxID=1891921 RepID=A0ABX3A2J5_9GAMM|nr:shikimate dehydrogenase [Piscirickettsia litoralis]ODN43091.1 shikimate dehydrogenase [Piscirickettsia litoralis]